MMICHNEKFVFVSTPKAGTHSMYAMLKSSFHVKLHTSDGSRMHSNILISGVEDYYKFTVVRDPFTRAVSSWWQMIKKTPVGADFKNQYLKRYSDSFQDFTKFLLEKEKYFDKYPKMFDSQNFWHNGIKFDSILKLENLKDDYSKLPFIKDTTIKKQFSLSSEREDWHNYYTEQDYLNIMQAYKDDFEVFGYDYIR